MMELNTYLQAKALWQPRKPIDKTFSEFMSGYYGKASVPLTKYINLLVANLKSSKASLDVYGSPVNHRNDFLSPEAIEQYSTLFDQAERSAEGDPELTNRINNARLPLEYTVLQQAQVNGADKHGYLKPSAKGFTTLPNWNGRINRFTAQAKKAGVKEISEGGVSPDNYKKEWDDLLSKPFQTSLAFRKKVTLRYPFSPEFTAKKKQHLQMESSAEQNSLLTGYSFMAMTW